MSHHGAEKMRYTHLSVLITPCMNPYTCHPATIFAFLLATSSTSFAPHASPGPSTPGSPRQRTSGSRSTRRATH